MVIVISFKECGGPGGYSRLTRCHDSKMQQSGWTIGLKLNRKKIKFALHC